ncbi:RNAse3 domain-containing protein [Rutstroemia sp. NJR-2017a BVV2]|nr:RNAse3 domain-containing protein [Rutstroemia sp. NJR-2017a BVV2]PQE18571.1 RNAse3 domain-containing protein [Rutstroemia sp. NJR-2017a BVV2]
MARSMHEFKTTGRDDISDSRPDHVQPSLSKAENLSRLLSVLDDVLNEQDANEMMGEVAFKQARELRHSLQTKKRLERDLPLPSLTLPPSAKSDASENRNLGNSISALQLTPWISSSIPSELPPLPKILDPTLEMAAFTHSGCLPGRVTDLSYERLEWVGDAYLYITSTLLISQTFPGLLPGKCSQLRERLIKNLILAEYARKYEFEKRAKLPSSIMAGNRTSATAHEMTKIMGDIFEAYVAAVVLSDPTNGVARVSEWLKNLWAMTLAKDIRTEERNGRFDSPLWRLRGAIEETCQENVKPRVESLNAKDRLQRAIGSRGVKLIYKDSGPVKKDSISKLPLYTVAVYLTGWGENGKQLGFGSALGKTEAGMKAAENALANKKMMSIYLEKKKVFDAQLERERAALAKQEEGH